MTTGRVAEADAARETDFVQSLERGLAVIQAFDEDNTALTLSEVARTTGLARGAARRFLRTLVDLGYVRFEGRLFHLSPRVLELGRAYLSSLVLPELALPHLSDLVAEIGESASVAVIDDTDIVYVAHVSAKRIMSISISVGTRDPAFATSLGRVLLAGESEDWLNAYLDKVELPAITRRTIADVARLRSELNRIRRNGFAIVDQELEEGLRAVAAPIRDREGNVIAAVNVAMHTSGWTVAAIRKQLVPRLIATAEAIERELAAAPARRVTPLAGSPERLNAVDLAAGAGGEMGDLGDREGDFIQSVQRGLAVVRAFDAQNTALTVSDVAKATGLPRAAARRFLLTLVDLDYMRVDGRLFRLRPRVLELGRPYLSSMTLPELALPHLRDFVADVREPATVAVLDGPDIAYIAHVPSRRVLSVSVSVGTRDPAFASSLGRALLAGQDEAWLDGYLKTTQFPSFTEKTVTDRGELADELARVREAGFALVDQELEEGLRALAVPIHDSDGRVIAAVNVAVHAKRWTVDAMRAQLLPRLIAAVAAIERDIGAAGSGSGLHAAGAPV